jgi:hypothetical protein
MGNRREEELKAVRQIKNIRPLLRVDDIRRAGLQVLGC